MFDQLVLFFFALDLLVERQVCSLQYLETGISEGYVR